MNFDMLIPKPIYVETFRRNREHFVPEAPGCYVLTTFTGVVLYLGLARNLRRRMNEHLDSPVKIRTTALGRAVLFYWIESDETQKIERTWMNIHIQHEGRLPVLNSVYSPVSI